MNDERAVVTSAGTVAETAERLKAILRERKVELFADIDHAEGAARAGLALRPTRVLVFGNAKVGTPLMQAAPSLALDLPLKVLVSEDAAGKVSMTYRRPEAIARWHDLGDHDEAVRALGDGLAALVNAAALAPPTA